jgi:hypothetical protein
LRAPATEAPRDAAAITCMEDTGETVSLRSTDRLPEASGAVRVERRGGMTQIGVDLGSMKPASLFGGDYNTYVLWIVPPRGPAQNAGEMILDDDRSRLEPSTDECVFAVIVTAEPHYLVNLPSPFVVLQPGPDARGSVVHFHVVEGLYNFERSSLEGAKEARGRVHTEMRQAFTAVRLARRAGAATLARVEFLKAQRALNQLMDQRHQTTDRGEIAMQARETVRLAVVAERLARDRAKGGDS